VQLGTNPGGATLGGGQLTVAAVNGVATFAGLTLTVPATGYTLTASSSATDEPTAVTTGSFGVQAAAATKLVVTAQPPSTVVAGQSFSLTVAVEDQFNNVVTNFNGSVTASVATNPGGSALSGTKVVNVSAGSATFSGLALNNAGNGYTLQLALSTGPSTTTGAFNVTNTPPPPPTPPTIIGETVVMNPKIKRKPATLSGYTITFSTAMDQSSLANPGNYQVAQKVIKNQKVKVGRRIVTRKVTMLKPIGFSVAQVTSNSVTLKLAGLQKFPKGGQLTVIAAPPGGVDDLSHVFLAHNGILSISPTGKGITLVS
jgi:hypothetical protein